MQPMDTLHMDDEAFELALARLGENELNHFQSEFRKLSFTNDLRVPKNKLNWISKKLYAIKKECQKRELKLKVSSKIEKIMTNPEDGLQFDEIDFKEIAKNMSKEDFSAYAQLFEKAYEEIINNRKNIFSLSNRQSLDTLRKNLKIIKRWDLIQQELKTLVE